MPQSGQKSMQSIMKDRIRQIMESQHMTQQVFAEFIGTTPATLSGIFNDRTRPTINIVESIKKKIPDISTDWLMFGTGEMYHHSASQPTSSISSSAGGDGHSVGSQPMESMIDFGVLPAPTPQNSVSVQPSYNGVKNTPGGFVRDGVKFVDKPIRHVTEIRVYYDDQTWESFVPSKK